MKDEWPGGFILHPSAFILRLRVTDGIRTRDIKDHNLALYQLSYSHHLAPPPEPNAASGVRLQVLPTPR
jgi:hypothetical protein